MAFLIALLTLYMLLTAAPIAAAPPLPPPPAPKALAAPSPQAVPAGFEEPARYEPRTVDVSAAPSGTRPITLDQSLQTGLQKNPRMKTAEERAIAARGRYKQAQSARNPHLQVDDTVTVQGARTVDSTKLFPNGQLPPGFPATLDVVDTLQNQAHVFIQQLLTSFGRVENQVAAAFVQVSVAAADAASDRRQLLYDIKLAYFARLQAEANVMVSELNLDSARLNLRDTQARYEHGIMARYDLVQAQIEVTSAQQNLETARASLDTSNTHLKEQLIDHEPTALWAIPPQPVEFDDKSSVQALQQIALSQRPEMISLHGSLDVARHLLAAAHSENAPTLSLQLNHYTNSGNSLLPDNSNNAVLLFQWPLFDGGLRAGKVMEAQSNLRTLQANVSLLEEQIRAQVEATFRELLKCREDVKLSMEKVEYAAQFYTMSRARYIRGIGTSLEMQNALNKLNEARLGVVVASSNLDRAFASLEQSLGQDFPDRRLVVQPAPVTPSSPTSTPQPATSPDKPNGQPHYINPEDK